ncbi:Transposon Ty3-G Gag-Pol polyprotein [Araneus ventricosus]|uniref:Transposon Ty3-G Gag-Pol polyprotein n=1 Tax=Araneus ventricosus TaxID=182803 RepID=A0A4Y2SZ40_ARAVE|nr:Transposon Ty3-G Gag-Pol polyprotein [Araneus ventricosus]
MLKEFEPLFSRPVQPVAIGEHVIELLPNVTRQKPHSYSVPMSYRREVDRQVKELLDLDLIEPSNADVPYPIVCVATKDASIRMCIDYRALNAVTKVSNYPMKDTQELIFTAGMAQWLSCLDLLKGYYQIKMHDENRVLTAFSTHNGVYQWKVMPFGLSGASGTFQKIMNNVLRSHSSYAQAYIDDIIVHSKTWDEHLIHLRNVLQELENEGFSVKLRKCTFAAKELQFSGHKIGGGKHAPGEEKNCGNKTARKAKDEKGSVPCTDESQCGERQKCVGEEGEKTCQCDNGLGGENCGIQEWCEKTRKFENCKGENGKCEYSREKRSVVCTCATGKKLHPEENICKAVPCTGESQCSEREKCVGKEGEKTCQCADGLSGNDCEKNDWCEDPGKFKYCKGENGKCEYSKEKRSVVCTCATGKKLHPQENICKDGCSTDKDCPETQKCVEKYGWKTCKCANGLSGNDCEKNDWCKETGKFKDCKGENGTCEYSKEKRSVVCTCTTGKKLHPKENICKGKIEY